MLSMTFGLYYRFYVRISEDHLSLRQFIFVTTRVAFQTFLCTTHACLGSYICYSQSVKPVITRND